MKARIPSTEVSHFLKKHEGMKIKGESKDFYRAGEDKDNSSTI